MIRPLTWLLCAGSLILAVPTNGSLQSDGEPLGPRFTLKILLGGVPLESSDRVASNVYAINDSGVVAGAAVVATPSGLDWVPALWDNQGLRILPGGTGEAVAINNRGQACGTVVRRSAGDIYYEGLLWEDGQAKTLAFPRVPAGTGKKRMSASAISDNGLMAGELAYHHYHPSGGWNYFEAGIIWENSGTRAQRVTPSTEVIVVFSAINNSGTAVGQFDESPVSSNGSMRVLPTYGFGGTANAINAAGTIGGGVGLQDGGQPVLWVRGRLQHLDRLGGSDGSVLGLNDNGDAVGWVDDRGPILWTAWNTTYELEDLVLDLDGWSLLTAYDINNSGQIVGIAEKEGTVAGFLLTPQICEPIQDQLPLPLSTTVPNGTSSASLIISDFGPRNVAIGNYFHPGIDFRASEGASCRAVESGYIRILNKNRTWVVELTNPDRSRRWEYLHSFSNATPTISRPLRSPPITGQPRFELGLRRDGRGYYLARYRDASMDELEAIFVNHDQESNDLMARSCVHQGEYIAPSGNSGASSAHLHLQVFEPATSTLAINPLYFGERRPSEKTVSLTAPQDGASYSGNQLISIRAVVKSETDADVDAVAFSLQHLGGDPATILSLTPVAGRPAFVYGGRPNDSRSPSVTNRATAKKPGERAQAIGVDFPGTSYALRPLPNPHPVSLDFGLDEYEARGLRANALAPGLYRLAVTVFDVQRASPKQAVAMLRIE